MSKYHQPDPDYDPTPDIERLTAAARSRPADPAHLNFRRDERTGTIHAYASDEPATLCGRQRWGAILWTTADKLWRNPDWCGSCARMIAHRGPGRP